MLEGKKILLIVTGGIAAYKSPDLVRRLRQRGAQVRCVLTAGGAEFVTALASGAVSEVKVYETLFPLTADDEMGHIRLSRAAPGPLPAPANLVGWAGSEGSGMVSTTGCIWSGWRSEEHTSELQSQAYLVCRLLLEKKNKSK